METTKPKKLFFFPPRTSFAYGTVVSAKGTRLKCYHLRIKKKINFSFKVFLLPICLCNDLRILPVQYSRLMLFLTWAGWIIDFLVHLLNWRTTIAKKKNQLSTKILIEVYDFSSVPSSKWKELFLFRLTQIVLFYWDFIVLGTP